MPTPNQAQPRRAMHPQPKQFGVNPTIQEKIVDFAKKKFGLDPSGMQGTMFTIFDTVALATSTTRTTYEFFNATQGKSANFTNFQSGTLSAGEFVGVEYLYIAIITTSNSGALNVDTTSMSALNPIIANVPLLGATVNLNIANQTYIKNQPLIEAHPAFNQDATGMTNFNATAVDALIGVSRIRLKSNPIIPPNIPIKLSLSVGPLTAVSNTCLWIGLGNTGSIFAPK